RSASLDPPEPPLREPRPDHAHRRHPARGERRHPRLPLPAHREPGVADALPLARALDRVLGQPLRPAPRHLGLLAERALRRARADQRHRAAHPCLRSLPLAGVVCATKTAIRPTPDPSRPPARGTIVDRREVLLTTL